MVVSLLIVIAYFVGVYYALITGWSLPHDNQYNDRTVGFWFITTPIAAVLALAAAIGGFSLYVDDQK